MWDTICENTCTAIGTIDRLEVTEPCYDVYPIAEEEKDCKRTIAYNVAGVKIKCEKIFKNKTKDTYLHFYGEGKVLDKKITFCKELFINTNVYDQYDWYINNGILYVVLFEKINEQPKFERAEKPKKEKVTE